MQLRHLPDLTIHSDLKTKAQAEREILSEIVQYIHEVDRRRLYEKFGYPSLFEYLVKEMKYSNGSAQRRIDAARMLKDVPELKDDLESGVLNLGHVSAVAHGLKQQKREQPKSSVASSVEVKRELLEKAKGHTVLKTQELVAKELNLEIKTQDRKIAQKDGSIREEMTFTKEEAALIQKSKDLLSHSNPGASTKEIFMRLVSDHVQKNDPALKGTLKPRKSAKAKMPTEESPAGSTIEVNAAIETSTAVAAPISTSNVKVKKSITVMKYKTPSAAVKRQLFQTQNCCQWTHETGEICGSTFQLQTDHRQPLWAGGGNEIENLQVLCAAHNKMKYRIESGQLRLV